MINLFLSCMSCENPARKKVSQCDTKPYAQNNKRTLLLTTHPRYNFLFSSFRQIKQSTFIFTFAVFQEEGENKKKRETMAVVDNDDEEDY